MKTIAKTTLAALLTALTGLSSANAATPPADAVTNEVTALLARSVDERLRAAADAKAAIPLFTDFYRNASNGVFRLNPSRWTADIDLSCVSVWNDSAEPHSHGGTAISRRHVLWATHWYLASGKKLFFLGNDGKLYTRTVGKCLSIATESGAYTDINIASLTEELPEAVVPAALLSPAALARIGSGKHLPALVINQDKFALVQDISKICGTNDTGRTVARMKPRDATRAKFHMAVRSMDSGSPSFLIYGNKPVLLGSHWRVNADSSVAKTTRQIQNAMDRLSAGYKLELVDFADAPGGGKTGKSP